MALADLLPARIREARKAKNTPPQTPARTGPAPDILPTRAGFVQGVPPGGFGEDAAGSQTGAAQNTTRSEWLQCLWEEYLRCPWAWSCVNVIARTVTAGGLLMKWDGDTGSFGQKQPEKPAAVLAAERLFAFTNPTQDIRQLCRNIVADLQVFGGAMIEVVWFAGIPVALYSQDFPTTYPDTDEHGSIRGYKQVTEDGREASFKPEQIIHITLDSARPSVFGISPTHAAEESIVAWMFLHACEKEAARRGLPPNIHADLPAGMGDPEVERWQNKYATRNIGPANIGTPITTKGGGVVKEIQTAKLSEILGAKKDARNEIVSSYGVPPAKVGIIESGNLGGGTGSDQNKSFWLDIINPIAALIAEKFQFAIAVKGFGVKGWHAEFGGVDYRDDQTIENIRDMRLRSGAWCVDEATEILTGDGWKPYQALKPGDDVLTLNHETGKSEWQECQEVAVFPAAPREMIRMRSRAHSSLTTVDHRWPVEQYRPRVKDKTRIRRWRTSETLTIWDRIQTAAQNTTLPVEAKYDDAFVELIAWFWTEGHAPPGAKYIFIFQKNQPGVDRIRTALEKYFGPPYERSPRHRKTDPGAWIERICPDDKHSFRVAASHGHLFREIVDDHIVSMEFLRALTQEQLDLFVEVSVLADGHNYRNASNLTQRRRLAAERFQIACILSGRAATVHEFRKSDRPHYRMWGVNVSRRAHVNPVQASRQSGCSSDSIVERVMHDGVVWCPVTPNQTWLARRDGTVYFTGNTRNRYAADIGEPPVDGGDDAVLVARQDIVLWSDMADRSAAAVAALGGGFGGGDDGDSPRKRGPAPAAGTGRPPGVGGAGSPQPSAETAAAVAQVLEWLRTRGEVAEHTPRLDARQRVRNQLAKNFPARAIRWVGDPGIHWDGPVHVLPSDVDTSDQHEWDAAADTAKVARIKRRYKRTGKMKPVVLVRTPGSGKDLIADGHHHYLAAVALGVPVKAYVGHVSKAHGPWNTLSLRQKRATAKEAATGRVSKAEAGYEPTTNPVVRCGTCVMFDDDRCTLVEGDIDPQSVCSQWQADGDSANAGEVA